MADLGQRQPRSVADVAERLMASYEDGMSAATVSAIVLEARNELEGQVPRGALPELLHRLADQRLAERAAAE
jgi:hypothetical protein